MSRSNKEARLSHSGMNIESGHGGMKRNKVRRKAKTVKPDTSKDDPGYVEKLVKGAKALSDRQEERAAAAPENSDAAAIRQMGEAGASIATTYKAKQAAKDKT